MTTAATRATTGVGARRLNTVTLVLIGINVAVYLVELAIGGGVDGTNNWIYDHGVLFANGAYQGTHLYGTAAPGVPIPSGLTPAGVDHGEWWRLITAAFLHYGPIHLGLNMMSLYFVGSILEQVIGRWRYVLLYLVSGLAGSGGALLVTANSPTAGASGAIFGVLGALLVLERRGNIATGGQVLGLIILNLVLSFAIPGISIGGHIGGLVGGLLLMLAYVRFRHTWQVSIAAATVVAAAAIIVSYAAI